jgi:hypothetical protein
MGGLDHYQQASLQGQSQERGGDPVQLGVEVLAEVLGVEAVDLAVVLVDVIGVGYRENGGEVEEHPRAHAVLMARLTPIQVGADQALDPGESMDFPVSFFVDPAIAENPDLDDVRVITLSYTFFPSRQSEQAADRTARLGAEPGELLRRGRPLRR